MSILGNILGALTAPNQPTKYIGGDDDKTTSPARRRTTKLVFDATANFGEIDHRPDFRLWTAARASTPSLSS